MQFYIPGANLSLSSTIASLTVSFFLFFFQIEVTNDAYFNQFFLVSYFLLVLHCLGIGMQYKLGDVFFESFDLQIQGAKHPSMNK